jgi:hypothetical protein
LLLVLSWLLGLSSAAAQSPAAPAAHDIDAAEVSACVAHANSSASIERLGTCSEEVVDPLEDRYDQATAQLVAFSPAAPQASISFELHLATPIRTPFINSAAARGPPST